MERQDEELRTVACFLAVLLSEHKWDTRLRWDIGAWQTFSPTSSGVNRVDIFCVLICLVLSANVCKFN